MWGEMFSDDAIVSVILGLLLRLSADEFFIERLGSRTRHVKSSRTILLSAPGTYEQ